MSRKNSAHLRLRQLAKRNGTAGGRGGTGSASLTAHAKPFRVAPAKKQLRKQASDALASFAGVVKRCPPARGKRVRP
jgi:hypothetical protein